MVYFGSQWSANICNMCWGYVVFKAGSVVYLKLPVCFFFFCFLNRMCLRSLVHLRPVPTKWTVSFKMICHGCCIILGPNSLFPWEISLFSIDYWQVQWAIFFFLVNWWLVAHFVGTGLICACCKCIVVSHEALDCFVWNWFFFSITEFYFTENVKGKETSYIEYCD